MASSHPALKELGNARVLTLNLSGLAFEITGTPEKQYELRNKSKWIEDRILNKDGSFKAFDYVMLISGYGNTLPTSYSSLLRFDVLSIPYIIVFLTEDSLFTKQMATILFN